jgi:hypothetical protein
MVRTNDFVTIHPTQANRNAAMNAKITGRYHRLADPVKYKLFIQ